MLQVASHAQVRKCLASASNCADGQRTRDARHRVKHMALPIVIGLRSDGLEVHPDAVDRFRDNFPDWTCNHFLHGFECKYPSRKHAFFL